MADSVVTQEQRLVSVETPLGQDKLIFRSMRMSEALGRPFEIQLELLSQDFEVPFDRLLGENVTVRLDPERGSERRYFNGYVAEFSQVGSHGQFACYRATLRPWLWFLTRTADCRIYQDMKVPAIVESVFRDHGFSDYQLPSGSFRTWKYCVQYRETDFNFVSRLLEQEGIYYYFAHENGKHVLKLCTPDSSKEAFPGYQAIPYVRESHDGFGEGGINTWELTRIVQPTTYALDDYNYEDPTTSLDAKDTIARRHAAGDYEIYDYPGEYATAGEGGTYAKVRIQEVQAEHERVFAAGDTRGIACGHVFNLEGDVLRRDQLREYLVVAADHRITAADIESGMGGSTVEYGCRFEAMDSRAPFRPARKTAKPVVQGPQTAVVVGPSGEEIHTDKHGRIKVQFHWDRYGNADDASSCWIRVAQSVAGKTWGAFTLPRIGQEVLVEFLEGDPDRPIVTGSVYNNVNLPPYDLPGEKNRLGLVTHSTKDGGAGFNELTFDDTKGKEQIIVHGQKDVNIKVENDSNADVGRNVSLKVKTDVDAEIGGKHSETTKGDYSVTAENIVLEAKSKITLKVGGSSIAIEASGITIKTSGTFEGNASQVKIEGKAKVDVKSGAMASIDGGGMTVVKGGMVKIN